MRRSTATLALALLLATCAILPPARCAEAALSTTRSAAVLTVGTWGDPAMCIDIAFWVARQAMRVMDLVDEEFRHLKDEVKRAIEHPQQFPGVVPIGPPVPPELQPLRHPPASHRLAHPAPVPDSLPLRSIS